MGTLTTICACCGTAFEARSVLAVYCNVNCKARAAYYRRTGRSVPPTKLTWERPKPIRPEVLQPTILAADDDDDELPAVWDAPPPAGVDQRIWQGTSIQRRQSDGFVNATAMCKAGGREWFTYVRSARAQEYIQALKAAPQICGTEVVQSVSGGTPSLQGTWIHPRLAVDLARWISPAFAVWMDGWFLESQSPAPLARGVHIVGDSQRDAHLIWAATLRRELIASLELLDRDLLGPVAARSAPVVVHAGR